MRAGLFKSLYFSLRRPADVQLLQRLLALPRSEQNRILKAALQEALPRYLKRHHPEIVPLPAEAVAAAVAATRRSPRSRPARPHQVTPPAAPPPPAPPPGDGDGARLKAPPSPTPAPSVPSLQETEQKLDRLLRAWTR